MRFESVPIDAMANSEVVLPGLLTRCRGSSHAHALERVHQRFMAMFSCVPGYDNR